MAISLEHVYSVHQFFTVSGLFLVPLLLEPETLCLFLGRGLPTAGVVLEFSLLPDSVRSVLKDTLLSTCHREGADVTHFTSYVMQRFRSTEVYYTH